MVRQIVIAVLSLLLAAIVIGEGIRQVQKSRPVAASVDGTKSQPRPKVESVGPRASWFKDVSDEVGLNFVQAVGPLGTHFMPEINGSGGAMFDYDNDGDLDLFLVNLGRSPKSSIEFGAEVNTSHRLYRQEKDGGFIDQTRACGLENTRRAEVQLGIGCAVGDVNNDGFEDLYVTNYGPDQLFINEGGERFVDRTNEAKLGCTEWGTAAAFFDYDRDGWLDLMVVNYCADKDFGHSIACGFVDGTLSYCGPHKFTPTIDRLYHNAGAAGLVDGVPRFVDVTESSGLASADSYGLGLAICDFDGDRWPDMFVANDMRENRLWMNQHDGSFREEAAQRGVARNGDGVAQGCMGVSVADVDRDLDFDLVVTNLVTEGSVLYINDGSGVFADQSRAFDLVSRTKQHTGWGVALIDLDLDGHLDMPSVNGFVVPGGSMFPPHGEDQFQSRVVESTAPEVFFSRYVDVNVLLMNDGKQKFVNANLQAGDFARPDGSNRGLVYGDVDRDGDLDLMSTSVGGKAKLFRNDVPRQGHWLKVSCHLPMHKRLAVGAVVRVYAGQQKWMNSLMPSSSYLASNDPAVHFGLGQVLRVERIEIDWPDGTSEQFAGASVDQHLQLMQGSGTAVLDRLSRQ